MTRRPEQNSNCGGNLIGSRAAPSQPIRELGQSFKKNGQRFLWFSILVLSAWYVFWELAWEQRLPAHPSAKHSFKNHARFLCFSILVANI